MRVIIFVFTVAIIEFVESSPVLLNISKITDQYFFGYHFKNLENSKKIKVKPL